MYMLKEDLQHSATAKGTLWNPVCAILVDVGIFQYLLMEDR